MGVTCGSPLRTGANSRTESLATDAATRSGCCRKTASANRSRNSSRVRPGGTGTVCPGERRLCSSPSMPPSASVCAGDGHSARWSAGTFSVAQSAAAAARPYCGLGPLPAIPKCPVTTNVPVR